MGKKVCQSCFQTDISAVLTPKPEDSGKTFLSVSKDMIPLPEERSGDVSEAEAGSSTPRSRSPRPSTLPGLNVNPAKLAHLAGKVVMESPQAPHKVKAFARYAKGKDTLHL